MGIESNSINEIKNTLKLLSEEQLRLHLLRIIKFRKENKELLSYILYLEDDIPQFIRDVKHELDAGFAALQFSSTYLSAKGLRKVLKMMNKYIKFSGNKEVELELVGYYCLKMKQSSVRIGSSVVLANLYNRQLERAEKAYDSIHEEKQADYRELWDNIRK